MNEWQMAMSTTRSRVGGLRSTVSTETDRRLGGVTVIETVRACFSSKMTFKQHGTRDKHMAGCLEEEPPEG